MAAVIENLDQIAEGMGRLAQTDMRPIACQAQLIPPFDDSQRLHTMRCAFFLVGGLVNGDTFSELLRKRYDKQISLLARWIIERQVLNFEAYGQRWLPLFQFDRDTLIVSDAVTEVISEMRDFSNDWELTEWFSSPNVWLDGDCPAQAIGINAKRVHEAARVERFVAVGY